MDKTANFEYNGEKLSIDRSHRYLGLVIDEKLNLKSIIDKTLKSIAKFCSVMYQLRYILTHLHCSGYT